MRVGSMATGAYGLDMAVDALWPGAEHAWFTETDKHASQVLEARFPDVPNLGDLLTAELSPVDILVGGLPCQPYSTNGKQEGADDDRDLFQHLPELVGRVGPRLVLLENVAALARSPEWRTVVGQLADLGYDCRWTIVAASDVGAPHQRKRLFAIAHRDSAGLRIEPGWIVGESRPGERIATHGAGPVTHAESGGRERSGIHVRPGRQDETSAEPAGSGAGDGWGDGFVADADGGRRAGRGRVLGARRRPQLAIGDRDFGPAIERWEHVTGVPMPPPVHGRNWCPKFGEWMMGWPIGWVSDVVPARHARRIIGNGVVPLQAEAAFRWLLEVE